MNKYIILILYRIVHFFFAKTQVNDKIYLNKESRILIIHFGSIQQALSLTPLIKVIKQFFNNSIYVLTDANNAKIFASNDDVQTIMELPSEMKLFFSLIMNLRKKNFDALILADESPNKISLIMLALIKSRYKVGFINKGSNLLTHRLPFGDKKRLHLVDRILTITEAFEIEYEKSHLNIIYNPSKKSTLSVETYRITHDLIHKPTLIINISSEIEIGFWGVDSYKRLIKFLKNYNINIILTASIDDMKEAELISENKYLIYYNTDFDSYAQLIKSSNFIFTPDSFTVQLAAAYKIPVYCLFVQHKSADMINVPYNSDFDFSLTEKPSLEKLSFGHVLNSFVPYFEYIYQRYSGNDEPE